MISDQKRPSEPPIGNKPTETRELFQECERREKVTQSEYATLRESLIGELSFRPLSSPAAKVDRYQALINNLKTAPDDDSVWYVLAQLLRSEGIREPKNFLPTAVWRRLTNEAEERLQGFLKTDDYNVYLVRVWLPYTEPLLRKTKWLRKRDIRNQKATLERIGYAPAAVELVLNKPNGWASAVELTCEWLEWRSSYNAASLRNSYSRVFGKQRLREMNCFFCDNPADGKFWVYGNPVLQCGSHSADRLPESELDAWSDRLGGRWRRQNLDILCSFPPA
jgi:hypothetical protein